MQSNVKTGDAFEDEEIPSYAMNVLCYFFSHDLAAFLNSPAF